MKKTIYLNEEQSVDVNASMGWLFVYRNEFGHDILPDLMPIIEAVLEAATEIFDKAKADENGEISLLDYLSDELIEKAIITLSGVELLTVVNIVWAMAKNEEPTLKEKPQEWVNQFDVFPYDIVVKEIAEVIIESSVSSKNSQRLLSNLKKTQLA